MPDAVLRKRRPTMLTLVMIEKLLLGFRQNKSVETVCKDCQISRGTFYKWIRLGKTNPNTVFGTLRISYDKFRIFQQ